APSPKDDAGPTPEAVERYADTLQCLANRRVWLPKAWAGVGPTESRRAFDDFLTGLAATSSSPRAHLESAPHAAQPPRIPPSPCPPPRDPPPTPDRRHRGPHHRHGRRPRLRRAGGVASHRRVALPRGVPRRRGRSAQGDRAGGRRAGEGARAPLRPRTPGG